MNYRTIRRLGVRTLSAAVLAALVVSLAACGGAQTRFESHLARGKDLLERGNTQKASVELRNALQIDPRNIEARVLTGQIAERRGNFREAIAAYRAAIDVDGTATRPRAALGRLMVFGGAAPQALEVIEPGLAAHPEDPDLLVVRAAASVAANDIAAALRDVDHVLTIAPANEYAIALRASLYRRAQQFEPAEKLVRDAIEKNPATIDLREVLAALYADAGDVGQAEQQLRKLIELRPLELSRRTRLAVLLISAKKPEAAQKVLEEAVTALPDDDQAKLQLVDFVAGQRSREEGEKSLRAYIERDPENDDLRLGLGALLQRVGANADARKVYDEIIARGPGPKALIARNRIATMQIAAGDLDAATKSIAAVLEENPRDLDALTMRGNIALSRGEPGAAVADLRTVLREQPEAVMVRRALARAHVAAREPALAEDALREALRGAPNDVGVRSDLGELLCQTNRVDACVTMLEETVHLAPEDASVREKLVRAYLAKKDLPSARTAAQDLVRLAPSSARGHYMSGLIAQSQDRLDDAAADFDRAIELEPSAIDTLTASARLDMSRGRTAHALARMRALIERDASNAAARNMLAELLFLTKDYAGAAREVEGAIAVTPGYWSSYRVLSDARAANGDQPGAVAALEQGIAATKEDSRLLVRLAALEEWRGKVERAIALYDKLASREPANQLVANNLAVLLVTHRSDKDSLDRAKALTESFSNAEAASLLDTHGWVRFRLGDVSAALPSLERASQRAPESRIIRYHLAMAQLQSGQRDKARVNLESAVASREPFDGIEQAREALAGLKRVANAG